MSDSQRLTSDLFHRAADLASAFRRDIPERLQRPEQTYGEARHFWLAPTPEQGTDATRVIDELASLAGPGLHASTGPRFYGWVIGASHPVGVAADWLTSAWGQKAGNHTASRPPQPPRRWPRSGCWIFFVRRRRRRWAS